MISSVIVKNDVTLIKFTKITIDLISGKMKTQEANYTVNDELREHVLNKHRVYLPCKIEVDTDVSEVPYVATLYVPVFWDSEAISNYTQALMDELFLYRHNIEGFKQLKHIEQNFMLEVIVL